MANWKYFLTKTDSSYNTKYFNITGDFNTFKMVDGVPTEYHVPFSNLDLWSKEECKEYGVDKIDMGDPPGPDYELVDFSVEEGPDGPIGKPVWSLIKVAEITRDQFLKGLLKKKLINIDEVVAALNDKKIPIFLQKAFDKIEDEMLKYDAFTAWYDKAHTVHIDGVFIKICFWKATREQLEDFFYMCSKL